MIGNKKGTGVSLNISKGYGRLWCPFIMLKNYDSVNLLL